MLDAAPDLRPPTTVARAAFVRPDVAWTFPGFGEDAFGILDRLRAHPHIDQYREEKEGIRAHLQEPFKRYRDDLVVGWVLPSRLAFETEKNVFSRLLKNDFGAGGCHHHLWMAFYRPGRRRVKDVQLAHSLSPDGLTIGLFAGDHMGAVFRAARDRVVEAPDALLERLNPLLAAGGWRWTVHYGGGKSADRDVFDAPVSEVPDAVRRANGLWVRTLIPRDDVLAAGPALVDAALDRVAALWPLYRHWAGPTETRPPANGR